MAETKTNDHELPKFILKALEESMRVEYEEVSKKMVEQFAKDIVTRREQVIAGVMLNVSKFMSIRDMQDKIVLEIVKVDKANEEKSHE